MLRKYGPFLGALVVLAFLFVWSENAVAPHFQSCVGQYGADRGDKEGKEKGRIVIETIVAESVCTLQLIDRHNGFFSALAAFAIAVFTWTLWRSTSGLLLATNKTIEITARNFTAEHRPWVLIDAEFDQLRFENGSIFFRLKYRLKNTGNSPAAGMFVFGKAILLRTGMRIDAERETFRIEAAQKAGIVRQIGGGMIFPNQGLPDSGYDLIVKSEEVAAAAFESGAERTVNLIALLCADYRFTFQDPATHQTVAMFMLPKIGVPQTNAIYGGLRQLTRFGIGDYAD